MRGESPGKMKVILVEDHVTLRQATAFLLDREPGFEVVAQAGTLAEARWMLAKDIEVAIVDLKLPDGDGIEFVKELREFNPAATVVVLTARADPETSALALKAGAAEVLSKSADVSEVVEAVRQLTDG